MTYDEAMDILQDMVDDQDACECGLSQDEAQELIILLADSTPLADGCTIRRTTVVTKDTTDFPKLPVIYDDFIVYTVSDSGMDGAATPHIIFAARTARERDDWVAGHVNENYYTTGKHIVSESEAQHVAIKKLDAVDRLVLGLKQRVKEVKGASRFKAGITPVDSIPHPGKL